MRNNERENEMSETKVSDVEFCAKHTKRCEALLANSPSGAPCVCEVWYDVQVRDASVKHTSPYAWRTPNLEGFATLAEAKAYAMEIRRHSNMRILRSSGATVLRIRGKR